MLLLQIAMTGITPACAGKRILGHNAKRIRQDHPRVCGEKFLIEMSMC